MHHKIVGDGFINILVVKSLCVLFLLFVGRTNTVMIGTAAVYFKIIITLSDNIQLMLHLVSVLFVMRDGKFLIASNLVALK